MNIWINSFTPFESYIIFALIFGEILIFISELAAFGILIKEKNGIMIFFYVIIANFLSLIAGGYLISILPL